MKYIKFRKIPTGKIEISRPELHHSPELTTMDYIVKANYEVLVIPFINGVMHTKPPHSENLKLAQQFHDNEQRIKDFIKKY